MRGFPEPLVLGSGSFTRKLILEEMNIPYHVLKRPIDEKQIGGDRSGPQVTPSKLVLDVAQAKMDHLLHELQAGRCNEDLPAKIDDDNNNKPPHQQEWIVLTGDQVVVCDSIIMEKPESVEQAIEFVGKYGTCPPQTVGSCIVTHYPSMTTVSGVDVATIYFQSSITTHAKTLVEKLLADDAPILSVRWICVVVLRKEIA